MKKFYLIALALLSLASCQQEETAVNEPYSDKFMAHLKFNTVQTAGTRAGADGPGLTTKVEDGEMINQDINIGIFSVRIARASRKCLDGFGFCDFKWFPKPYDKDLNNLLVNNELYKNSFYIKADQYGNKFVDLELSEKPAELDISRLQPLVVEEELQSSSTVNGKLQDITVPQGTYSFDKSIGEFGGYRIPLK